jgi:hypothetical protein
MRLAVAFLMAWVCLNSAEAQAPKLDKRYGIEVDPENFSQKTPKDTLNSILKAVQMKKINYVVAHLADPAFVDKRVKEVHGGKFEEMVKETATQLMDSPDTLKQLRQFIKDGEWEEQDTTASAKLKDLKDRVFLRKLEDRWFLENRKAPAK